MACIGDLTNMLLAETAAMPPAETTIRPSEM
jgi:hypothetical protein